MIDNSVDEDICPYDVYGKDNELSLSNFSDGAYRVHYECLTTQEQKQFEKQKC